MILIKEASKKYGNDFVLKGINLNLDDNGIYCLLGRNGAGKTTLLKAIAGHLNLTAGEIYLDDKKVSTLNMPKDLSFFETIKPQFNMKLKDLLEYSKKLNQNFDQDFATRIATKFKLDPDKKYKQLSFGMKIMLGTLLSLASNNKVVILDEPTLGFDAIMREKFYSLLMECWQKKPCIIIVSTHLIDEIAKIAQKIIIINDGRLLGLHSVDEIDEFAYSINGLTDEVERAITELNVIYKKEVGGFTSAYVYDKRPAKIGNCNIKPLSLQEYFINLVGGEEND